MKWNQLVIGLKRDDLEMATSILYDLGVEGFQIEDNTLSEEEKAAMYVGYVDESILNVTDSIIIRCYFSELENIDEYKRQVQEAFISYNLPLEHMAIETTDEEDWAHNWKKYFKTFKLGKHMVVRPLWEVYEAEAEDLVIIIDPGMAFGSGTHETTSMCIRAVEALDFVPNSVLDVGCGSGILSIAAAHLGAKKVTGIDIDVNAVKIAKENIEHNQVSDIVEILQGDLLEQVTEQYDLVFANILAEVIIAITPNIPNVIKQGGVFIASGIIKDNKNGVLKALETNGFIVDKIMEEGEWVTIISVLGV